jgi:hypothetical protein
VSLPSGGKSGLLALTKRDLVAPREVCVRDTPRARIFSFPQGRQIAIRTPFLQSPNPAFSLESLLRINASISGALASIRSHCSL